MTSSDKLVIGSIAVACLSLLIAVSPTHRHVQEAAEMKKAIAAAHAYMKATAAAGYTMTRDGVQVSCESGVIIAHNRDLSRADTEAAYLEACNKVVPQR